MQNSSPWNLEMEPRVFPTLETTIKVDVAIIGGGIAGVTAAYELAKAGKKVALLEQNRIAGGASGWTTAFVTQVTDASLAQLQKTFGAEQAALVWKSGSQAIDELERIIREEKIDCDFMRCPAYIFASDEHDLKNLHEEEHLAKGFGFSVQVKDVPLGFASAGYLQVDAQAKFHPVKFLHMLVERAVGQGVQVFENSKVTSYSGTSPCVVKTESGEVHAQQVILATDSPNGNPDLVAQRLTAYQTYVLEANIPSGVLPEAIFWDTQQPYHYFRVDKFPTHDRLILGGEDHKTGQDMDANSHFTSLEAFLKKLFPDMTYEIVRKWSGEILETIDGLPFIGKTHVNSHLFMATGFSGNGMTFGVLSAMMIRDAILDRDTPTMRLYRTRRYSGLWNFMIGGMNFMAQRLRGLMRKGDAIALKDIKLDDGAVVELNGKKIAVYKSADGKITKLSPICTHLQCTVQWNTAGKTWDCPCHGSRFKKDGNVMNGPAKFPLEKLD